MKTTPRMTVQKAQAAANYFLNNHLGDRFTADEAKLSETGESWQVPIIITYPSIGSLGQVGEIWIDAISEAILSHTSLEEMKQTGIRLYETHCDEIQAAFS